MESFIGNAISFLDGRSRSSRTIPCVCGGIGGKECACARRSGAGRRECERGGVLARAGGSVDRGVESVHVTYQLAGRHHAAQLHDSWAHQVKVFGSTARKLIVGQHLKDESNDSIVKPLSPGALGNGQCEEGRIMNEQRY